jgi:ribosomal protein S18 acetylase RimI-like enzyme
LIERRRSFDSFLGADMSVDHSLRRMTVADVEAVARLHAEELASSFLGQLGSGFLRRLYRYMLSDPAFASWVVSRDTRIVGYVAATLDTDGFYGRIYRKHFVPLAATVAWRALRRPTLAWQAVGVLTGSTPETSPDGDRAELLSIAVRASERGTGAGKQLVAALRREIATRGQKSCSVIVAEGIDAHHFYRATGFVEKGRFRLHGDPCSLYVLEVDVAAAGESTGEVPPRARATSATATTTTSSSK